MCKYHNIAFIILVLLLSRMDTLAFELPAEQNFLLKKAANITVVDAKGNRVPLFEPGNRHAIVISPVYTKCPMACSLITSGLQKAVKKSGGLGTNYSILTVSFDSTDTPYDLAKFQRRWKMDGEHWKCVTASPDDLRTLLGSLDYHYDLDTVSGEYDHPNVVIVLTPTGRISRYLYGMEPKARDLRISTLEANQERSKLNGGLFESIYLRCFSYDPKSKTYKVDWGFILQTGIGLLIVVVIGNILRKIVAD